MALHGTLVNTKIKFLQHHHCQALDSRFNFHVGIVKLFLYRKQKVFYSNIQGVQLKSGPYFNMSNLFTRIYNMSYYTTNLYLQ